MTRPRRPLAAFSLVELLVALALTSVLMWALVTLYSHCCRLAADHTTQAELALNGRAALDLITRDLAAASPLATGHLVIDQPADAPFARLQFTAPVGPAGERAHVLYEVRDLDARGTGTLYRCLRVPAADADPIPDPATGYPIVSATGVRLNSLAIEHAMGHDDLRTGSAIWHGPLARGPRSILITIALSNPDRSVQLVLSTGTVLMSTGL